LENYGFCDGSFYGTHYGIVEESLGLASFLILLLKYLFGLGVGGSFAGFEFCVAEFGVELLVWVWIESFRVARALIDALVRFKRIIFQL
jgi:hypothetical protein